MTNKSYEIIIDPGRTKILIRIIQNQLEYIPTDGSIMQILI